MWKRRVSLLSYVLTGLPGSSGCVAIAADVPVPAQIRQVEAHLLRGNRAYQAQDWQAAIAACKQGLDALGSAYYDDAAIDDTGQALVAGWGAERDRKFSVAATLYCGVLRDRLQSFRDKQTRQSALFREPK